MIPLIPLEVKRLYKLLPQTYRRRLWGVSISVFIMAVLDLLGTGILLPVLLLVLNEKMVLENHYMSLLYHWMGFGSIHSFIFFICIFVLLFSLVRVCLSTWLQYKQNQRLFSISSYLSIRLYRYYYSKGYLYIKQNNSHKLINQVNGIANNLIQGYFVPFSQLTCEILVMCSILIGLISFNVYVFLLVILTFVPITLTYYRYSRSRIKEYGRKLYLLIPQKGKLLQQTFVGFTDLEMSNTFPQSLERFSDLLKEQNRLSVRNLLLNNSLQKVLEIAIVSSVVVLIVATQLFEFPALGLIVGVFAIAVYRVLPGIVKSTGCIFQMRGNLFAFDIISDLESEPQTEEVVEQHPIEFKESITIRNLSFSYSKEKQIFNDYSLNIQKGDFVGFRGESGCGKSTLFHLILGFLKPDSGGIYIDEIELSVDKLSAWRSKIGYVSQQLFMVEGSLLDNIIMGSEECNNMERVKQVLHLASLDSFVATLPEGVFTSVGEGGSLLSGGQRQRLGIARALYKRAEILMFDEATSSLDEATEHLINDSIVRLSEECPGLTLLVISHRPESLAVCRRIVDICNLQQHEK
ncbi:ABC transporter ATP-binding protein [Parabacteroides sp.]|uniref:ABC transporter ATP-binding protein n=1 Tax=Parabacteroides sp. TaxID=1869337 RepID=UPI0030803857